MRKRRLAVDPKRMRKWFVTHAAQYPRICPQTAHKNTSYCVPFVWQLPLSTTLLAEPTPAAACSLDQETHAHVAIVVREPAYALAAIRACPDRYCASLGRRLLIFGMTANVATIATICPAELAAICAAEVTSICALLPPSAGMGTVQPTNQ